jgi:GNAT superfamily N-acetyltransferase
VSTSYNKPTPTTVGDTRGLMIKELCYRHPDAYDLVKALFDEQVKRYGYADPVDTDPDLYRPPHGLFLVGYDNGRAICCGGYRSYRADTVEIKKMYTVPERRGQGYGLAIINELERRAAEVGVRCTILETGVRNTAALALYRSVGYQPTARYVPGRDPAINRAFLKRLVAASVHCATGSASRTL